MSAPMKDEDWWPSQGHQSSGLHSRIMITAIASLALVVVLVVVLHLYARYALRRHRLARRRSTLTSLFRADAADASGAASPEPPKAGLDPFIISSLPTFSYKRAVSPTDGDGGAAECAVCLCALEEGEVLRLLPNCSHVFHVGCIDVWLHSHSSCPVCRAEAEPAPVVAAAEAAKLGRTPSCSSSAPAAAVVGAAAGEEGTSGPSCKEQQEGSTSRLNASLRRMLSRGRSQRRSVQTDGVEDVERQ